MNKKIPENTLAIFEDNGKTIYLTLIQRVPVELKEYPPNSWYGKADGNGDFLYFTLIEGYYPDIYMENSYFLQLIPEKGIFKLKLFLNYSTNFKEGKMIITEHGLDGQWEDAGYSIDNTLWVKIFEYYQETVKNDVNGNVTESRTEKTPKGTLETFGVAGAPIYLTEINFITKDDSILQDFTDSYDSIGNGDYFVTFKIIDGNYPYNYVVKKYIMHIIPEKNTSTFEIQFVSDTDYENEISEEGEIMYGWLFGWATEDELSDHQYIKIYEYVKDWKKQAKKKN